MWKRENKERVDLEEVLKTPPPTSPVTPVRAAEPTPAATVTSIASGVFVVKNASCAPHVQQK